MEQPPTSASTLSLTPPSDPAKTKPKPVPVLNVKESPPHSAVRRELTASQLVEELRKDMFREVITTRRVARCMDRLMAIIDDDATTASVRIKAINSYMTWAFGPAASLTQITVDASRNVQYVEQQDVDKRRGELFNKLAAACEAHKDALAFRDNMIRRGERLRAAQEQQVPELPPAKIA